MKYLRLLVAAVVGAASTLLVMLQLPASFRQPPSKAGVGSQAEVPRGIRRDADAQRTAASLFTPDNEFLRLRTAIVAIGGEDVRESELAGWYFWPTNAHFHLLTPRSAPLVLRVAEEAIRRSNELDSDLRRKLLTDLVPGLKHLLSETAACMRDEFASRAHHEKDPVIAKLFLDAVERE